MFGLSLDEKKREEKMRIEKEKKRKANDEIMNKIFLKQKECEHHFNIFIFEQSHILPTSNIQVTVYTAICEKCLFKTSF